MGPLFLCDDGRPSQAAPRSVHRGLGLEAQAFVDPRHLELDGPPVKAHEEALRGITARALHGPFGDLAPGSFDPLVRDLARWRFEQGLGIARRLGATHLILHHGYVPGTSDPARWLERSTAFWTAFLTGAPPCEVRGPALAALPPPPLHVHLENHLEHSPGMIADLVDAVRSGLRRVSATGRDGPALTIDACLDIGHAHCYGRAPVLEWIRRLGTRIGYVHLHDNDRREDAHRELGRGTAPLVEACEALRETAPDAVWALEVELADLDASLDWLVVHGFREG
jgi:sugar phosphate isomerase/epimerase